MKREKKEEKRKEVLDLRRQGLTLAEISHIVGTTRQSVHLLLGSIVSEILEEKYCQRDRDYINDEDLKHRACGLYMQSIPLAEIERLTGISPHLLMQLLRARGIPRDRRTAKITQEQTDQVLRLIGDGYSCNQAAKACGLGRATVQKIARANLKNGETQ